MQSVGSAQVISHRIILSLSTVDVEQMLFRRSKRKVASASVFQLPSLFSIQKILNLILFSLFKDPTRDTSNELYIRGSLSILVQILII